MEGLPNINTSIKTLAAEIANLGSKVENLCSLVDHFEDNMEKVSNHTVDPEIGVTTSTLSFLLEP
jgi:hypothetical protein